MEAFCVLNRLTSRDALGHQTCSGVRVGEVLPEFLLGLDLPETSTTAKKTNEEQRKYQKNEVCIAEVSES